MAFLPLITVSITQLSGWAFWVSLSLALVLGFAWIPFIISLAISLGSQLVQALLPKAPIKNGQREGELYTQNAEEGETIKEIYGGAPYFARQDVLWDETDAANVTIDPDDNSVEKTSGTDDFFGDAGCHTEEHLFADGEDFFLSWRITSLGKVQVGMTRFPVVDFLDFRNYPWAIIVSDATFDGHPANTICIYDGLGFSTVYFDSAYTEGDQLAITRQSGVVKYWHNNEAIYTSTYVDDNGIAQNRHLGRP